MLQKITNWVNKPRGWTYVAYFLLGFAIVYNLSFYTLIILFYPLSAPRNDIIGFLIVTISVILGIISGHLSSKDKDLNYGEIKNEI